MFPTDAQQRLVRSEHLQRKLDVRVTENQYWASCDNQGWVVEALQTYNYDNGELLKKARKSSAR